MSKIYVISIWIGKLPSSFELWKQSCFWNKNVNFLLVTDQLDSGHFENLEVRHMTLSDVSKIFEDYLGFGISLQSPYKLNDFKMLYWLLCDDVKSHSYIGWSDIDLVYGDLLSILSPFLGKADRIFGVGHLSLVRSNDKYLNSFKWEGGPSYQSVFTSSKFFGFDEEHGINIKWRFNKDAIFIERTDLILDVIPRFSTMVLHHLPLNFFNNFITCSPDGVFLHSKKFLLWRFTEYAYFHMQKRKWNHGSLSNEFILTDNLTLIDGGTDNIGFYKSSTTFRFEAMNNRINYFIRRLKIYIRQR